jgi:16S rRNA pseudouridine516 synthase
MATDYKKLQNVSDIRGVALAGVAGENVTSACNITIMEGRYHQIKRMFKACDMEVLYLKRLSMGPVSLDEDLPLGGYRKLTEEEIKSLKEVHKA